MSTATTDIRLFSNSFAWRGTAAVQPGHHLPRQRQLGRRFPPDDLRPPLPGRGSSGDDARAGRDRHHPSPGLPVDGQEFTLVDSLTAPTYSWRFRYMASMTDSYKWVLSGAHKGGGR